MNYGDGYYELIVERSTLKAKNKVLLAALEKIIEGVADGGELEGLSSGTPVSVPIDDIWAAVEAIAKVTKGGAK